MSTNEFNTYGQTASNAASSLKRAKLFLEDGDWTSAELYCEKTLDADPTNGNAYLYLLMAKFKVKTLEDFRDCKEDFGEDPLYQKVIRFSGEELIDEIAEYRKENNMRIAARKELERLEAEKAALAAKQEREATIARLAPKMKMAKMLSKRVIGVGCPTIGLGVIAMGVNGKSYAYGSARMCLIYFRNRDNNPIIAVAGASNHAVALHLDGSARGIYLKENAMLIEGQADFIESNIIDISCSDHNTFLLDAFGRVTAFGNNKYGACNVQNWSNISKIYSNCLFRTLGFSSIDGRLYVAGDKEPFEGNDPEQWTDLKDIVVAQNNNTTLVGIKKDNSVLLNFDNLSDRGFVQYSVEKYIFDDVVDICWYDHHIYVLNSAGEILGHKHPKKVIQINRSGVLYEDGTVGSYSGDIVKGFSDIVAISEFDGKMLGIRRDGQVVADNRSVQWTSELTSIKGLREIVAEWKLFDDYDRAYEQLCEYEEMRTLTAEKIEAAYAQKAQKEKAEQEEWDRRWSYRQRGLCQYCGGELKGLLAKKCVTCGRKKDY